MEPALSDGTVVDIVPYDDASPERGDVIVFVAPTGIQREFAKRIIGLSGDEVKVDTSADLVLVNGLRLTEPYARRPTQCARANVPPSPASSPGEAGFADWWIAGDPCDVTVPEGHYYVLGDNRQNSSDSRQGWLVPAENIIGRIEVD